MVKMFVVLLLVILSCASELNAVVEDPQKQQSNMEVTDIEGNFACPMDDISMDDGRNENYFDHLDNVGSYLLCGTFCARTDNCNYWTWFEYGSTSERCLLFDANAQTNSKPGAKSGEKDCPADIVQEPACPEDYDITIVKFGPQQPLNEISFDDGKTANYLDIIKDVENERLCGQLCARTTVCLYWTWYQSEHINRKEGDCVMFDSLNELNDDDHAISGDKYWPNTTPEGYCEGVTGASAEIQNSGLLCLLGMATYAVFIKAFRV